VEWADHSSGFICNADNVYYVNKKVMLAQVETPRTYVCIRWTGCVRITPRVPYPRGPGRGVERNQACQKARLLERPEVSQVVDSTELLERFYRDLLHELGEFAQRRTATAVGAAVVAKRVAVAYGIEVAQRLPPSHALPVQSGTNGLRTFGGQASESPR